jgi:hypothetical protein
VIVYIDTEFWERPTTIDLISIGLVREDGKEYYAESSDFDEDRCTSEWLRKNVLNQLIHWEQRKARSRIAAEVLQFVGPEPKFYGYYCDYDWVVFCWLFGAMIDLPKGFPKFCMDLKQDLVRVGNPRIPFKPEKEHNALSDAQWIAKAHKWLIEGNFNE